MLEVKEVKKKYGKNVVLRGVDLTVGKGRICGLLGLNGEGKSTLMKIICGLSFANGGEVIVCGKKVGDGEAPENVGAMIEDPAFYGSLTGRQNLEYFASLCPGVPTDRVDKVLSVVGVGAKADALYKTYSLGMKRRLYFAFALLKKPEVLILDEPFNGVDPVSVKLFEDVIKAMAADGCAVLISGHIIAELMNVCDSAAILDGGVIRAYYDSLEGIDLNAEFLSLVSNSGDVR